MLTEFNNIHIFNWICNSVHLTELQTKSLGQVLLPLPFLHFPQLLFSLILNKIFSGRVIEKIYCFVILACNASSPLITGIPQPPENNFSEQVKQLRKNGCFDKIPLVPSTPEEMEDMLKLCSYVRFKVPHQVSKWHHRKIFLSRISPQISCFIVDYK